MNSEIKILKPEDIKSNLVAFFKNKSVVPIVGSGFTCGLNAFKGTVPNGCEYKKYMETKLVEQDFSEEEKRKFYQLVFRHYVIIMKMMKILHKKLVVIT